ncbi:glycoside hydrolase N-terminal domain-containing protein [Paenibacillus sp. PR3]|uniref:Glycoside hydrolase N-terminal domain-containing protein n=1 Tax=Paenibacillus terricola TaxID=2763503 RepID=A0ABR8MRM8_9BACL|nr:glycoside hydrolase N-terminal domain-containing protein [Paenibacillus terricola]MBD3917204.1 glycoside hydrolase N-terminal domain-containing protein [Paenibacillus terricola]
MTTIESEQQRMFHKGNFSRTYTDIPAANPGNEWRDGMVSGNGENGYITSGSPYRDCFIFQNMWFNFPSAEPRDIPEELTGQLEEARHHVYQLNDQWKIKDANGNTRVRTFYYSFHPGHQLRLEVMKRGNVSAYERWTNHETAETGVRYTDEHGQWLRTSFTSREDNVSITRLTQSSKGSKINLILSIEDIANMARAYNGHSEVKALQYKKIVDENAQYIAQAAHYPSYPLSEWKNGGYAGLTQIVIAGGTKNRIMLEETDDPMNVGVEQNPAIQVIDADAVYLITTSRRVDDMGKLEAFAGLARYGAIEELFAITNAVSEKYRDGNGIFHYEAALAPHVAKHAAEYNAVSLKLHDEADCCTTDNGSLLQAQKADPVKLDLALLERIYNQGRYAMICCGGSSAPRLYGMWTGEWNPGWRGIYTLDANVNLQVSAMNTGHLTQMPLGYITFFLRNAPDFEYNARMAYGMHDALQVSVNSDGDRGMHVEYDNDYPFEYWNAGASWCLLPIYEYWQCYGNQQIPIQEKMRIQSLQSILSVRDGGLTDKEFADLLNSGYLDLERDILLPLLTKQANFWEQICTPEYFTDINGRACYQKGKTSLMAGEKYIIIPTYSPENHPIGYNSTITANATMDISAARDGLHMIIAVERAVKREGYQAAVTRWEKVLELLPEYRYDADGALREWAMSEYTENNDHRHLSHLYPAWPAYETQNNLDLAQAASLALANRNKYNTNDATAGHGWMHKALVTARLKDGEGVAASLLPMMTNEGYYESLMSDHDTNRRCHTYCTDTLFGTVGAVNEALLFSNTGEIEVLPALPSDWLIGSIQGLMARTRIEVKQLSWSLAEGTVTVTLQSLENYNEVRLKSGLPWNQAVVNGVAAEVKSGAEGAYIHLMLHDKREVTVVFS